jgi:hypothetical protein
MPPEVVVNAHPCTQIEASSGFRFESPPRLVFSLMAVAGRADNTIELGKSYRGRFPPLDGPPFMVGPLVFGTV